LGQVQSGTVRGFNGCYTFRFRMEKGQIGKKIAAPRVRGGGVRVKGERL
jgi:hypothetical protein